MRTAVEGSVWPETASRRFLICEALVEVRVAMQVVRGRCWLVVGLLPARAAPWETTRNVPYGEAQEEELRRQSTMEN
jgi:hypothetical protein